MGNRMLCFSGLSIRPAVGSDELHGVNMNVLIVEHSRTVANKLSALFGKYGFEPYVTRFGRDALEMLKDIPVELLHQQWMVKIVQIK